MALLVAANVADTFRVALECQWCRAASRRWIRWWTSMVDRALAKGPLNLNFGCRRVTL